MICDSHLHYGDPVEMECIVASSSLRNRVPCYQTVQFQEMGDYEAQLKKHNIDKTVLVPSVFREHERKQESMRCIEYAKRDPEKYFPYILLDEKQLEFLEEHVKEIVGVKEHIVLHESILTKEKCEIFKLMEEHGLILLLHSQKDRRVEYVKSILKQFPKLKIQIAHMGRGAGRDTAMCRTVFQEFRSYANIVFDTSTIREPEVLKAAVELVGAERILYGSDFPFFMDAEGKEDIMEEQIEQVFKANLTERERDAIFYENFCRFVTYGT
ncbi:amidohydrolase family protein [Roseburia hominis]